MIPEEVLKKIHLIHIRTKHLVNDVVAGEYESAFRGRGMEFQEVREYQPGDDVRTIDWNVTARMDRPFVKLYREERELTVMLMVDISASGQFGSREKLKKEVAAEVAALLAYTAIRNNDKVGLILFTDRVEKYVPPKKAAGHGWRVIREILSFEPEGQGTDLSQALEFMGHVQRKRCICFLLSDFITSGYEKQLRLTNKRHDMIALTITDPREEELPAVGFVELEDAETGELMLIDTRDQEMCRQYRDLQLRQSRERTRLFRSMNLDHVRLSTHVSYVDPLLAFFRRREKNLYR
jgi:uncharacterized protein (DUF58 family)